MVRMQVMARKLYQNLGDRMSRCFAINPVGDGQDGKIQGGRWTSHTGERERGTEGREGVRQGIRGEERRGRVEGEQKERIARGWMGLGWSWGWKQMASFVLRLLRGESRDGKSRTRFRVTCDY